MLGYWQAAEQEGYGYDPDQAMQILDADGWAEGSGGVREKGGEPLKIAFPLGQWPIGQKYAEAAQAQFKEIGVEAELTVMETAAYNSLIDSGDYDLTVTRWTWPDPDILYTLFHSSQTGTDGNNDALIKDPELDRLLEAGRTTVDPAERARIYEDVQKLLITQAVTIPLVHPNEIFAYRSNVHGFAIDPRSYMWLYDVWIEQ
jgi:peptide/nickel transport system substrate-binding protein